jgi:transcriptional regulator with XRE-family HTH domain
MLHHAKKAKRRQKKLNLSLVRLREIIGRTQAEFAAMIGVSVDTIKSLETGRLALSPRLAGAIRLATGADVGDLHRGDGRLTDCGAEYQRKHFDLWRTHYFPSSERQAKEWLDRIVLPHMRLLFLAASKSGRAKLKDRLPGLLLSWQRWEQDAVASFRLEPEIDALLNRKPLRDSRTLTWGEWRQSHPLTQRFYGFKDDPRKRAGQPLTLEVTPRRLFTPGASLGDF